MRRNQRDIVTDIHQLREVNTKLLQVLDELTTRAEACDQHFNWEAQEFQPVEAVFLRIAAAQAREAIKEVTWASGN